MSLAKRYTDAPHRMAPDLTMTAKELIEQLSQVSPDSPPTPLQGVEERATLQTADVICQ